MSSFDPPFSRLQVQRSSASVRRRSTARQLRAAACAGIAALVGLTLGCRGDVEARMAEVRALQDVGQFTESVGELREILAVTPDLPEANYRLGVALVQTGDPSRAVWALQKASESPDYAIIAGLQLATAHMNVGNLEEVVDDNHAIISTSLGPEYYVAIMSFVDKDQLVPGASVLLHNKAMSIPSLLSPSLPVWRMAFITSFFISSNTREG